MAMVAFSDLKLFFVTFLNLSSLKKLKSSLYNCILFSSLPYQFSQRMDFMKLQYYFPPLSSTIPNNVNSLFFLFSSRKHFLMYKIIIYFTSVYHFLASKNICRNLLQFTTKFLRFVPYDLIRCFLERQTMLLFVWFPPMYTRLKVKMTA